MQKIYHFRVNAFQSDLQKNSSEQAKNGSIWPLNPGIEPIHPEKGRRPALPGENRS
jgi:hypothetical protein